MEVAGKLADEYTTELEEARKRLAEQGPKICIVCASFYFSSNIAIVLASPYILVLAL